MIQIYKSKTKIEFYGSIEDLPHRNYMKFNKEMMKANEVGSSIGGIMGRISRAKRFLSSKFSDKALIELNNAEIAYNYMMQEIDPQGLALAAITKSIGGVACEDYTTNGLLSTLTKLQDLGITKKEIDTHTNEVKKKLKPSLSYFSPTNLAQKIFHGMRRLLKR